MAIALLLAVIVPIQAVSASGTVTPAWGGTIQTAITEPLVVKVGGTILPDGYTFSPVSLKVGETKTYTIAVQNTGATPWLVKPTVVTNSDVVTAVWNTAGVNIVAGGASDFILTLTAINVTAANTVTVGFTRETP